MSVKQIVKQLAKIAGNKRSVGATYHGKIYTRAIGKDITELSATDGIMLAVVRIPENLLPVIRDRVFVPVDKAELFVKGGDATYDGCEIPVWHKEQFVKLGDGSRGHASCNPAYMTIAFEIVKACDQEARVIMANGFQEPIFVLGEGKASSDMTCMVMVMPLRESRGSSPTLYDLGLAVSRYQGIQ